SSGTDDEPGLEGSGREETGDRRSSPEAMSPSARVAIVGAGAWGTTLAVLVARSEPVALIAHDAAAASRIDAARENERRLPGVRLPNEVLVTADASAVSDAE